MAEYSMVRETPPAGWEAMLRDRNTRTFIRSIKEEAKRKAVAFDNLAGIKAIMDRHLAFEALFKGIDMNLRQPTGTRTKGIATRADTLTIKVAAGSANATLLAACVTNATVMRPQGMDYAVRVTALADEGGNKVFAMTVIDE